MLAWLHRSTQLTAATTGYLCDALLEWALQGLAWPPESEPAAGADCDHLQALVTINERLAQRIVLAETIGEKFDLARVGRHLTQAICCQHDPDALQASLDRELLHDKPWLAGRVAPVVLPDGRVR